MRIVEKIGEEPPGSGRGKVLTGYSDSHVRQCHRQFSAMLASLLFVAMVAAVCTPAQAASKYASIVIDNNNGRVLYSRSADSPRYPASLTKIMTLYMLFAELDAGRIKPETRLKVSRFAAGKPPSKLGLKPGQTIRVVDAIRSLVTKSANDVATVVAENLGGTESQFAKMMTLKARDIGMTKTTFRNASGLPNKAQLTTARDMATLSRRIMTDFPDYYGYFRLKYFSYKGKRYRNHNGLLFSYKGTNGVKTGYTRASGFNLAASVIRGKKHLIAVVMGGKTSKSRNAHMQTLLNKSWKRASLHRKPQPARPRSVPLPPRHPLGTTEIPVASAAPRAVAAVVPATTAALPKVDGVTLDSRDSQALLSAHVTSKADRSTGDYHVQVGAYSSQTEAVARLKAVRSKASRVLAGHDPITLPLPNPKRYLFRARFAGFSEAAARNTCSALIRQKIPCIVMRAD